MTKTKTTSLLLAAALTGALAGNALAAPSLRPLADGTVRLDDGKTAPPPKAEPDKKADADKKAEPDKKADAGKDKAACGGKDGCGAKKK